jgi:hypothetical protein
MEHTKTPWHIGIFSELRISGADGIGIAQLSEISPRRDYNESVANAAHIVRCVNAHDALVAALEQCLPYVDLYRRMALGEGNVAALNSRAALKLARCE